MGVLTGKKVLAFGDSIIDGHLYKKAGFMEFVADQEGMELIKYANNGACIMPGTPIDAEGLGGMIMEDQVLKAAEKGYKPDMIVFDGGTNDAYEPVLERLGDAEADDTRTDTFAGAFRKTVEEMKKIWPGAKIVYVAVHRLAYRDREVQEALHGIETAVCARMGVAVVNLYDECELDTADEAMCRKYSFDVLKDGLPAPGKDPTGTHPNLEAIREFYLPFTAEALKRMEAFRFGEIGWDAQDDSIMLYWELPEKAASGDRYRILLNGEIVAEAEETHCPVGGLKPESRYELELQAVRGGEVVQSARLFLRTKRRRERLDVTKAPYGAVGDGVTLNTEILQKAIEDCGPDQAVYVPAGVFLTGALRLHSDIELYLDRGAVLKGSAAPEDYLPRVLSRFEGTELDTFSGLLNIGELDHLAGCRAKNIVIRGAGIIEGGGRELAERVIEEERLHLKPYMDSLGEKIKEYEKPETLPGRVRPRLIHICNAERVSISGLTLKNGASWNVHMIYSRNILTYDCRFYSRNIWNGDGWDPDSSENCVIFGCTFDTGDDAVAVKSGKNPEGNVVNRPCEHIRIFDCLCAFGHGVALGSEMSGGIRDVKIWNCDLRNSAYGVEVKATRKRGGYVRDVEVRCCILPRLMVHSVPYNDDGEAASELPVFENFSICDTELTGERLNEETGGMEPCEILELSGFPEEGHHLKNVRFKNVRAAKEGGSFGKMRMEYVESMVFE